MIRSIRSAVIAATSIYMGAMAALPLLVTAQTLETRLATEAQRLDDTMRRVSTLEALNLQAELATIKEFQRSSKETQDQNQRLLYGVFLSVATLAIERLWQVRGRRKEHQDE